MLSYQVDGGKLEDWGKPKWAEPKWGNPIMLLELSPSDAVQFSVTFPMVTEGARSVTFHCPVLNGWQSEFALESIRLRDYTPDEERAEQPPDVKANPSRASSLLPEIEDARSRGRTRDIKTGCVLETLRGSKMATGPLKRLLTVRRYPNSLRLIATLAYRDIRLS